jgi:hypothetical protein
MLYFSTAPVRPDSIDEQQYRALSEFKDSVRQRGLFQEYESPTEFQVKLTRQLAQNVIQHFPVTNHSASSQEVVTKVKPIPLNKPDSATLSPEARQLLSRAILDQHGVILMVNTFGGLTVETNGESFAERGNPRSEAKWRSVVNELLGKGYIEQNDQNGEVSVVTNAGYGVK